ncbi:hypothetical protein [Legionella sp.]|uniref:hypothetical protein n=1 Tax=Legionella sp. TaxID=459 RepID=UPI003C7FB809
MDGARHCEQSEAPGVQGEIIEVKEVFHKDLTISVSVWMEPVIASKAKQPRGSG